MHTGRCIVRTNIDLDEALVEQAMKLTNVRTKKELVHQALHEFVENHGRRDMRELRGRVPFGLADVIYQELLQGVATEGEFDRLSHRPSRHRERPAVPARRQGLRADGGGGAGVAALRALILLPMSRPG